MAHDPTGPESPSPRSTEGLFAEYLARLERGEAPELDALCDQHPDLAQELRRRHSVWQRAGRALSRLAAQESRAGSPSRAGAGHHGAPDSAAPTQGRGRGPAPKADVFWHRYTIQEEIGRGGMGSILSVHDEDFDRELAMKVLRGKGGLFSGLDDAPTPRDEKARFFEEARITGRLQHPSIVPVHELGLDPDGKPYFTMKLVEGRTFRQILPLAREGREGWSVQRALGVLLRVCEAVGFAHDKGVIHRDLKPANLMVGSFGEVYVMDWGLARDLTRPEPPRPEAEEQFDWETQEFRTRDGDVIGTPEYMSPEQATGRREEVGPLSDVFAMGAMLYELLTGQSPHGAKGSKSPVVRLAAAIGSQHAEVRRLAPDTPAELCAICERAIESDPANRYPSMIELAEDLRAYLEGRVVQAYASGAWAELRKWVRRNPVVATLGGALVASVVIGLVVISGLALRISQQKSDLEQRGVELTTANESLRVKTREATENLSLAQRREVDADLARALAERREAEAKAAGEEARRRSRELETVTEFQASMLRDIDAETMGRGILAHQREQIAAGYLHAGAGAEQVEQRLGSFEDLSSHINPTDLALTVLDENILSKALATIGSQFADQPVVEADLRRSTGETYLQLGLYRSALPQLERSLELQRRELGPEDGDTLITINLVGTALENLGRPADAEGFYREAHGGACALLGPAHPRTLSVVNNLAILLRSMNRYDEAEALQREALAGSRAAEGDRDRDTLAMIGNLGSLLFSRGEYEEAEVLQREALDGNRRVLGEDHPQTLASLSNLAKLLKSLNRQAEAFTYFEAALLGRRRVLGDRHPETLGALNNFGLMLKLMGDLEAAEVCYREALEGLRATLGDEHPVTFDAINNMGSLLKAQERYEEAEPYYREALAGNQRTYGENHQRTLIFKNNLGALLRELERMDEAHVLIGEARAGAELELGADHPLTLHFTWSLGSLQRARGELAEAEELLRAGLGKLRKLTPHSARLEEAFLKDLGRTIVALERWSDAEVVLLERHALARRKAQDDPSEAYRVGESIEALVELYEAWDGAQPGEVHALQAEAWRSQLPAETEADDAGESEQR